MKMRKKLPLWIDIPAVIIVSYAGVFLLLALYGHIAVETEFGEVFTYAISGTSMETTIHQTIQAEEKSLGAIAWIDREAERGIDSILLFRTPDGKLSVKRVAKIRFAPVKQYWLEPDNAGITGEGSGWGSYDWIDDKLVVGTVVAIWTPQRFFRFFTGRGRFENSISFSLSPTKVIWGLDKRAIAITHDDGSFHLQYVGWSRSWIGKFDRWEGDYVLYNKADGTKWKLWPRTLVEEKVQYQMGLSCGAVYSTSSIGFEGDVRSKIRLGQKLNLDGIVVKITRIELEKMGPEGAATVVYFTPSLSSEPSQTSRWKLLD